MSDALSDSILEAIEALKFYMDFKDEGERARRALAGLALALCDEPQKLSLPV